jgi:hypothetical protein
MSKMPIRTLTAIVRWVASTAPTRKSVSLKRGRSHAHDRAGQPLDQRLRYNRIPGSPASSVNLMKPLRPNSADYTRETDIDVTLVRNC